MLTQDRSELPFDLQGYFCIQYRWRTNKDRKDLAGSIINLLKKIDADNDPKFGPVHYHLTVKAQGVVDFDRKLAVKRLVALTTELSYLIVEFQARMEKCAQNHPQELEYDASEARLMISSVGNREFLLGVLKEVYEIPQNLPCVDLLITKNYIPDGFLSDEDLGLFLNRLYMLRYSKSIFSNEERFDKLFETILHLKSMSVFARLCLEKEWKGARYSEFDHSLHQDAFGPQF